jgi:hypothetical protein
MLNPNHGPTLSGSLSPGESADCAASQRR